MPVVKIAIRQHQFNVSCAPGDEAAMRAAARLLEEKINAIRQQSKIADGERACLMAALQIAFDGQKQTPPARLAASPALAARVGDVLARTESFLQKRALSDMNQ